MNQEYTYVCKWIGNNEGCRHPSMYNKSYCEDHYDRIYHRYPTHVALSLIEKDINSVLELSVDY